MIKKCTCEHEYQDEKHGKGMRVCNKLAMAKGSGVRPQYRCTVCKRILE